MARVICSGFEIEATLVGRIDSISGTGASRDTSIFRSGASSAKVALTSGVAGSFQLLKDNAGFALANGYSRFYILVTARPATTARQIFGSISASNDHLKLNASGTIGIYNNTTLVGTSSTALTDTTRWYRVEVNSNSGDAGGVLFIDGRQEVAGTGTGNTVQPFCGCRNDTVADTYTAYFDDVVLDSTALPGDGKVVLLTPTADNARGTGWVGGAGGTTNLFGAVDNTPPVGVADTGTDTSQIRNATSAANSNMDFTMTSYAAAGIGESDVVKAVRPMCITAAPVSTGAKQGTVGMVSNPAIANIALSATGVAGAFWNGTAAGTYPTGWKASDGTFTDSPSVTIATAPVQRVTQVTSSTRIADVCFVGTYVDYIPHDSLVPSMRRRNRIIR